MTVVLKGCELELIGPSKDLAVRQLPLITLPWLNEGPALLPVLMGRNGRPRAAVTMPGHGKGQRPLNYGLRFPADPPTADEVLRILDACDDTTTDIRNRALFTLLWRSGLRVSEALALRPHHVDFTASTVTVLAGKGGKRRVSAIDAGGLAEVSRWLFERARLPIDQVRAPLFCTVQQPGVGNLVHPAYVRDRLHLLAERARVPRRVAPHQLRHAHAVELAREGVPVHLISRQLGHSNLATTATYLSSISAADVVELISARVMPS